MSERFSIRSACSDAARRSIIVWMLKEAVKASRSDEQAPSGCRSRSTSDQLHATG